MTTLKVNDVMTREPITLREEDDLLKAKTLMVDHRVRHLPVVDADRRLIGLLTQRDLLRLRESPFSGVLPDEQEEMDRWAKVSDVMTRGVKTLPSATPLLEAAELLREEPIGCLPIVDADKLCGILTEADFVEIVIRMIGDPGR